MGNISPFLLYDVMCYAIYTNVNVVAVWFLACLPRCVDTSTMDMVDPWKMTDIWIWLVMGVVDPWMAGTMNDPWIWRVILGYGG